MSEQEQIEVEIDETGKVEISVRGVKGKACKELTRSLESALGTVSESKATREYTEAPRKENRLGQR